MGETDPEISESNPYQTPQQISVTAHGDWDSYIDGVLRFDVAITRRDVRRFIPRSNWWVYIYVALLAFLLLFSKDAETDGPPYLFVFIVALPLFVVLFVRWLQVFLLLRQMPSLTEPYSGWLEPTGLAATSVHSESFGTWSDCYDVVMTKKCLLVRFDRSQVASLIIPWESFEQPDDAQTVLKTVCEQRKQLAPAEIGDAKMAMKVSGPFRWEPPPQHVTFDGEISFRDILATKPGKKVKRMIRLFLLAGICALPIAVLSPMFFGLSGILVTFPLAFLGFFLALIAMAHPLMKKDNDQVAFRLRGWVSSERISIGASTRESNSRWSEYTDCWHDDDHICLRVRGFLSGWCFLARHQFKSDEDYQQACQWIAAGLKLVKNGPDSADSSS